MKEKNSVSQFVFASEEGTTHRHLPDFSMQIGINSSRGKWFYLIKLDDS